MRPLPPKNFLAARSVTLDAIVPLGLEAALPVHLVHQDKRVNPGRTDNQELLDRGDKLAPKLVQSATQHALSVLLEHPDSPDLMVHLDLADHPASQELPVREEMADNPGHLDHQETLEHQEDPASQEDLANQEPQEQSEDMALPAHPAHQAALVNQEPRDNPETKPAQDSLVHQGLLEVPGNPASQEGPVNPAPQEAVEFPVQMLHTAHAPDDRDRLRLAMDLLRPPPMSAQAQLLQLALEWEGTTNTREALLAEDTLLPEVRLDLIVVLLLALSKSMIKGKN